MPTKYSLVNLLGTKIESMIAIFFFFSLTTL